MNAQLRNASIHSDSLGRYYTADWVSNVLVNAIDYTAPSLIIELGVGDGSLSTVAMNKWMDSQLVTVDIDRNLHVLPKLAGVKNHVHHHHDVLDYILDESIGVKFGSADITLCNPPYIRPRWRDSFRAILSAAGLSTSLITLHDAGADLLFLAQNLRLLKKHGKLGLILPDGLITGDRYLGVRKVLLNEHAVEEVIQLPRNAFANTEAQAYLVIVSKEAGPTKEVQLKSFRGRDIDPHVLIVDAYKGVERLDYRYHLIRQTAVAHCRYGKDSIRLGDLSDDLKRGMVSSNEIANSTWPIFHLNDFPTNLSDIGLRLPRSIRIPKRELKGLADVCIAGPGDILLGRVGRNLHDKVCLLRTGHCIISDCVFRLRVDKAYQAAIYGFLKSNDGRSFVESATHGVGAKYLNKQDVFNLPIPLTYF